MHEITRSDMYWARGIAYSLRGYLDPDEAWGCALEGLAQAARDYNPKLGVYFRHYARRRIKGAILDGQRRIDYLTIKHRRAVSAGLMEDPGQPLSLEAHADMCGLSIAEVIGTVDHLDVNWETPATDAVAQLPGRHGQVVRMHLTREMTHAQIGEHFGFSRARSHKLYERGISRLRDQLAPVHLTT